MQATAAGAGICVLPCVLADPDRRLVRLLQRQTRLIRTFWMIVHSDTRGLARIKATNFIANAVREAGDLFLPRQG
ncbi:ModE molybdate transport repressor domain-containing protein (fragment) [Mesorhizobium plurifarium]|uniref:ModE molybdate transport repressor domain-containing protein n=1 Tax=Mesorhizobium plurifarium TaxID=69974 RepID=A0A0K2W1C6_MESPL